MDKEILHMVRSVMGCMLVTALAAGCAQEDIGNAPSEGGGLSATSYVSLSFASPQGTPRALIILREAKRATGRRPDKLMKTQ